MDKVLKILNIVAEILSAIVFLRKTTNKNDK